MKQKKAPAKPKKVRCLFCEFIGRECICIKPVKTQEMLDYRLEWHIKNLASEKRRQEILEEIRRGNGGSAKGRKPRNAPAND